MAGSMSALQAIWAHHERAGRAALRLGVVSNSCPCEAPPFGARHTCSLGCQARLLVVEAGDAGPFGPLPEAEASAAAAVIHSSTKVSGAQCMRVSNPVEMGTWRPGVVPRESVTRRLMSSTHSCNPPVAMK